jgi:hypothetical protein
MERLGSLSFAAMGLAWFAAACTAGIATWIRWPLLALALLTVGLARATRRSVVALAPVAVPLALLAAYGIGLSAFSRAPALAFAKCVVFTATAWTCLQGGALWVDRFGRDAIFARWRTVWIVFLAVAVAGSVLGRWRTGPEGLYGFTGNPNQLASLVGSLGLLLFVPYGLQIRNWKTWVEGVASVGLVLATRSRTAIAAVAGAIVVALVVGRARHRWGLVAVPLLVAAASFVFLPDQSVRQVQTVADTPTFGGILRTRESNWRASWEGLVEGMPMGLGWGVKAGKTPEWNWDSRTWGYGREEGTSWLPIGEELGLPGIALFLWIWVVLARAAHSAVLQPLALGGLTFFFVMATFEGWLLSGGNWESFAFWTFVGVVLAHPRVAPAPLPPPREATAPAGPAGALP